MKVYIGGPMRGLPQFNFPAFDSLAAWLRRIGWDVANPAEHDRAVIGQDILETAPGYAEGDIGTWVEATGFSFADAMRWDLNEVLKRDGIVLLPGWENSTGARYERAVAEAAGKQVWLAHPAWDLQPNVWDVVLDRVQKRLSVQVVVPLEAAA